MLLCSTLWGPSASSIGHEKFQGSSADNKILRNKSHKTYTGRQQYHGTNRTKHTLADNKISRNKSYKTCPGRQKISRNKWYKTYIGKQQNNKSYKTYTSSLCEMMLPNAVQKKTLDVYRCDETWEFINLALLCVACLLSERKRSMCPGVMIDNARKDACTECSICQSPRYAK